MKTTTPWVIFDPRGRELVGYIPTFISLDDPRPAIEQLDSNYAHGGGWSPLEGWTFDKGTKAIRYPGDPPLKPVAGTILRDEQIYVYPHAWVCVVAKDGTYQVARMD